MLTMTIDGHAVQMNAADAAFLADSLRAALAYQGRSFARAHQGAAGKFLVTGGLEQCDTGRGFQAVRSGTDTPPHGTPVTDC